MRRETFASDAATSLAMNCERHGRAPTLTAERLELVARDLRTKAKTLVQTVEETLTTRAGRLREWVRGSRHSQAETTEILSEKDVRIDGTKIRLG